MVEPTELEGVVKFHLDFSPAAPLPKAQVDQLIHWHHRLHTRGLIGRDPERYGGLAYGNLSRRLADGSFVISATQTADIPAPTPEHYARVTRWDCGANTVAASGPAMPSSESLTHAALYDTDPAIGYVFHIHSPEIWLVRDALGLATTDPQVAYGTPEMAAEVTRLYRWADFAGCGVIAMGGHADGIISFGRDAEQAGQGLLELLRAAD